VVLGVLGQMPSWFALGANWEEECQMLVNSRRRTIGIRIDKASLPICARGSPQPALKGHAGTVSAKARPQAVQAKARPSLAASPSGASRAASSGNLRAIRQLARRMVRRNVS
jgi:hypothetical protein